MLARWPVSDLSADAGDRWHSAAELFGRPSAAYRPLRIQLRDRISEEAELGIAFQKDEPVIVLLHADRITVARPAEPSSERSAIEFQSIPLGTPLRVGLVVGEAQMPEGIFRRRIWTLGDPGPTAIVLETRARVSSFAAEEIGGEALIVEAAARLGWPGKVS
jgi:hypothetical protein